MEARGETSDRDARRDPGGSKRRRPATARRWTGEEKGRARRDARASGATVAGDRTRIATRGVDAETRASASTGARATPYPKRSSSEAARRAQQQLGRTETLVASKIFQLCPNRITDARIGSGSRVRAAYPRAPCSPRGVDAPGVHGVLEHPQLVIRARDPLAPPRARLRRRLRAFEARPRHPPGFRHARAPPRRRRHVRRVRRVRPARAPPRASPRTAAPPPSPPPPSPPPPSAASLAASPGPRLARERERSRIHPRTRTRPQTPPRPSSPPSSPGPPARTSAVSFARRTRARR